MKVTKITVLFCFFIHSLQVEDFFITNWTIFILYLRWEVRIEHKKSLNMLSIWSFCQWLYHRQILKEIMSPNKTKRIILENNSAAFTIVYFIAGTDATVRHIKDEDRNNLNFHWNAILIMKLSVLLSRWSLTWRLDQIVIEKLYNKRK